MVHIDLCGPMQTPSLTFNVYFMTFIDDFSRKTSLYLLKWKYQAFDVFKSFKAIAAKWSNKFIQVLTSYRGGIEEVSICQMNLQNFINIIELKDNLLLTTLHNKTE